MFNGLNTQLIYTTIKYSIFTEANLAKQQFTNSFPHKPGKLPVCEEIFQCSERRHSCLIPLQHRNAKHQSYSTSSQIKRILYTLYFSIHSKHTRVVEMGSLIFEYSLYRDPASSFCIFCFFCEYFFSFST